MATSALSLVGRRFLSSTTVMRLFGYKNRPAFHAWVKKSAIPHIRLNARKFIFDEQQLTDWISRHSSTGR